MAEYDSSKAEEALQSNIVNSIIPRMAKRRGRTEDPTADEIKEKLTRLNSSGKPGEFLEFDEEVRRDVVGVDGQFASEVADLVYYCSQPNCPTEQVESMNRWFSLLGIPKKIALEFCTIKYECRIAWGDQPDHKVLENSSLDNFIDETYPHLKTIWKA